jgi:hypothetical protein
MYLHPKATKQIIIIKYTTIQSCLNAIQYDIIIALAQKKVEKKIGIPNLTIIMA